MTTLKYGSTGDLVKDLQSALNRACSALNRACSALNRAGCKLTVDGVFGSKTTTVVKVIQREYGLTVDGIVGPETWKVLEQWLVSWEDLGKAMHQLINDMEDLPSFKKLMELIPND